MTEAQLQLSVHFLEVEPQAAARQLELLPVLQASLLLQKTSPAVVAQIFRAMFPNVAAKILVLLPRDSIFIWLEKLNAADLSAILRYVELEERDKLLQCLPRSKQSLCKILIAYPEYSVGSLVETDVLILEQHMLIDDALIRLKKRHHGYLQEIFVVNQQRQLVGKLAIAQLFSLAPTTLLSNAMTFNAPNVIATLDISAAIELAHWQSFDTLAVINRKHEFIGVLHHHSLRHFMLRKEAHQNKADSISSDLIENYGETIVSMLDLMSPTLINQK